MVPELAVTAYTKAYSDFVSQQVVRPSADAEGLVENALPSGPITENENASPSGPSTGNASSSEARADNPIPVPPIPDEDAGAQTSGARPPSYKSECRVPIKHAARKSKQKVPSSFRMRVEGGPVPP